jgi:CubicO group peptidase (beta-lactamase class C family)
MVLGLSLFFTARAQEPDVDTIVSSAVASYFQMHPRAVGLMIGISQRGERRYFSYGRLGAEAGSGSGAGSRVGSALKPDSNTIFEIGSITKTFTSLLLAQAVVEERATLRDSAGKWLPAGLQLFRSGKSVTLQELSNHSSGLPRMMGNFTASPGFDHTNPYKTYSRDLLLDWLGKNPPEADPGSRYLYSNLGAAVLGCCLDSIFGKPYASLLSERIFRPLNMTRTTLGGVVDSNEAQGYLNGSPAAHWDFDVIAPAGAIRSSAHDLLNYLEAQLDGKNKAMQLTHRTTFTVNTNLQIGLAWHLLVLSKGTTIVWHNGGTGGFSSFAGIDPKTGTAIVVLTNNGKAGSADLVGVNILKKLLL